jgi:hypothetical protein
MDDRNASPRPDHRATRDAQHPTPVTAPLTGPAPCIDDTKPCFIDEQQPSASTRLAARSVLDLWRSSAGVDGAPIVEEQHRLAVRVLLGEGCSPRRGERSCRRKQQRWAVDRDDKRPQASIRRHGLARGEGPQVAWFRDPAENLLWGGRKR